ncbi:MAG: hypothetical protein OWQ48_07000 [Desulfurococcus sp.]|nr:hypothetical protein [Desulfurococcus sp.]
MEVFVELRNGRWIRVAGWLKQTPSPRRSTKYILVGESVENPPKLSSEHTLRVPASILNKIILSLLDSGENSIVVFERAGVAHYIAKAESRRALQIVNNIVEEVKKSRKTSRSGQSA